MNPRRWWQQLGHAGLLALAFVYCVFPIYFMLVQSLKGAKEDVFGHPLIVTRPTFENFEELFNPRGESRGYVGRALAVWAMRSLGAGLSYEAIARQLGRLHQSSVVALHQKAIAARLTDRQFAQACDRVVFAATAAKGERT